MSELFEMKVKLYTELLKKDIDELSEDDANIMFALAADNEIQNFLESKKCKTLDSQIHANDVSSKHAVQ